MSIWKINTINKFDEFSIQWNLLCKETYDTPLLDAKFIKPLLESFSDGSELLAFAFDDDKCVAATIIKRIGIGRWETFQPSQAPLGCWICHPDYCTDDLFKELASSLPGSVICIGVTQQDPALLARPSPSPHLDTLDYISTGRLSIPDNFDNYWSTRSKNVRQNTNKAKNRLKKEGIAPSIEVINNVNQMQDLVKEFGTLESQGWKAQSGTAVSPDNVQGRFYTELLNAYAPEQAEVWRYLYNDRTVAVDLCLKQNGILYILKTTFDQDWSRYSPAFAMHIEGVNYCSTNGINSIEFYGPAMEWHKKLTDDLRRMYHINFYPLSFIKRIKRIIN
ncbi:GNAT family N-acetyltransferase [Motiliproteus coralliicola]|uniref:GNAT family N-acetyltransferase n=1 Tax=Motiliproteus coralliicola TaxID=2283196 RepID=A0A369WSZ8_9GAMM|nr:GNAT family N-acetyltransferase [Motiliproteus coralliicola]RDE24812.1 GNAT family N-acetyltransferase [Motiliproteus coralliicola]